MSRYKAYPAYQDSEVEWLGEAPSHWTCIPVGRLYRRTKRTNFPEKELLSVYRDHGVVPTSSRDDNNNKPSEDMTAYQLVEPDNLVMNKMKAWQGSIAISEYEGIVSPAYFVYEPNAKMFDLAIPKYIHYLLRHPIYVAQYLRQSKGIRVNQWDLDPDEFKKIELLLPAKEEQKKIINFLDHETAKIDALIEKQQRLIELLKEKRQAVISHAVTKGLNPKAPMKDSGVEWLGEVPAHWRVSKCGFHVSILPGYAFQSSGFSESDEDTKLLRGINVGVNSLKWDEVVYWKRKPSDGLDAYVMQEGDIVIGMDRPLISDGIRVAKVKESDLPCLLLQRVASIKTSEHLDADYLLMLLSSNMFSAHFAPDTTGVSVPHISPDQIGNFVIPIPTVDEQKRIVSFVSSASRKLIELLSKAEEAIALMKERRTALISAAVTGKIDVRDWQAAA